MPFQLSFTWRVVVIVLVLLLVLGLRVLYGVRRNRSNKRSPPAHTGDYSRIVQRANAPRTTQTPIRSPDALPTQPPLPPEPLVRRSTPQDLLKDIRRHTLDVASVAPCNCKGDRYGKCSGNGTSAVILHALHDDGFDRALKIYTYGSHTFDRGHLNRVNERLKSLKPQCFYTTEFIPDGAVLKSGDQEVRYDVAIMRGGLKVPDLEKLLYSSKPAPTKQQLKQIAKGLRRAYAELASHGLAHGDVCLANIAVEISGSDGSIKIYLLDTDSLSWPGNTQVASSIIGQPSHFTPGRKKDPINYVRIAGNNLSLIDAPAEIMTYIAVVAEILGDRSLVMEIELKPAAFAKGQTRILQAVRERTTSDNAHFAELLATLDAHVKSPSGLDTSKPLPFTARTDAAFNAFEESL